MLPEVLLVVGYRLNYMGAILPVEFQLRIPQLLLEGLQGIMPPLINIKLFTTAIMKEMGSVIKLQLPQKWMRPQPHG